MTSSDPLAAFGRAYVINLASRPDRLAEIDAQLRRVGSGIAQANVQRFDAVRPDDAGSFPSVGARGCFMSHLGVLRDALARRASRIVILEDDLDFADAFEPLMHALAVPLAASAWSVFYGGHRTALPLAPGEHGRVEIEADVEVGTTHFVAFQGEAIERATRYLEGLLGRDAGDVAGGPMHVDGAYSWFRRANPDLRTWLAVPELGHQRSSRSDVGELRWYDRTPLVRDVAAAVRRRGR